MSLLPMGRLHRSTNAAQPAVACSVRVVSILHPCACPVLRCRSPIVWSSRVLFRLSSRPRSRVSFRPCPAPPGFSPLTAATPIRPETHDVVSLRRPCRSSQPPHAPRWRARGTPSQRERSTHSSLLLVPARPAAAVMSRGPRRPPILRQSRSCFESIVPRRALHCLRLPLCFRSLPTCIRPSLCLATAAT